MNVMRTMNAVLKLSVCALITGALVGCPSNPKPTSLFSATARLGEAPLTVTFQDASAIAEPGGAPIETWMWDFGDGTTSTDAMPSHTYTAPGTYSVTLTTTRTGKRNKVATSTSTNANFINVLSATRTEGSEAGEEATFDGIQFVWIPAGSFEMGVPASESADNYPDASPRHMVTISRGFWMSKFELTQAQYFALTTENDSFFRYPDQPNSPVLPVDSISWDDAQRMISEMNAAKQDEAIYRLPTEAEWEYACRAGSTTNFHFGDAAYGDASIDMYGWTNFSAENQTNDVGLLLPNDWGLYDMHGNLWEWTQDRYDAAYYASSPDTDPFGPDVGSYNVARGGSWYNQAFTAVSASRFQFIPAAKYNILGVRLVRQ